jgi:hypothetical protein
MTPRRLAPPPAPGANGRTGAGRRKTRPRGLGPGRFRPKTQWRLNMRGHAAFGRGGRRPAWALGTPSAKCKLPIIGGTGRLPVGRQGAGLFIQPVAKRREKKPAALTANRPFGKRTETFNSPPTANAILGRLSRHSRVVKITGRPTGLRHYGRLRFCPEKHCAIIVPVSLKLLRTSAL